jgi:hypothetical protein
MAAGATATSSSSSSASSSSSISGAHSGDNGQDTTIEGGGPGAAGAAAAASSTPRSSSLSRGSMWVAQHFKLVNSGVPVLLNTVNLFHRCVGCGGCGGWEWKLDCSIAALFHPLVANCGLCCPLTAREPPTQTADP